jgi:hypothetical protein
VARSKLDVKQAAQVLGISTDAVHKRVKRGTLEAEKDEDGRVLVWIDSEDNGYSSSSQVVHPLLLTHLESENEFLRQELERRAEELSEMRRIIAALVQRVPELEPAKQQEPTPRPREYPETASESTGTGTDQSNEQEQQERSWWQKLFGA